MQFVFIIIVSYLLGCFSSAYVLGRFSQKIDIREFGSGNSGTTNALRVLGKKMAILTLVLDVLKGIIAVLISRAILGENGAMLGGVFAVLGHNFPVFLNFKGGKGVATSIAVLTMINWKIGLSILIIAITIMAITRLVSLGSIIGAILAPIATIFFIKPFNLNLFLTVLFLATLLVVRHKANIERLLKGQENKLGKKS